RKARTEGGIVPFQPAEPIVSSRESDPDATDLMPILDMPDSSSSRYERNSGGLPRLEDDPGWSPPTFEVTSPIMDDPTPRWFDRFRR
ncbi:MAG: hypothetical protein M3096_02065, partial [Actinomycetia bacterium]|nr:hypothetical protein [Actinomycetes bacterium]